MSLTTEAAAGGLNAYFENQGKVKKNDVDLANDQAMLDWNTTNSKQKPLDRQSHMMSGLLAIYAAHPEIYGKTDWSMFGDLGKPGVTRADMTYEKAPTLQRGGSGGGGSKLAAIGGGLLKGASQFLGNKDAAKNDATGRAMNQGSGGNNSPSNYGGGGDRFDDSFDNGQTQGRTSDYKGPGDVGSFLQEDGSFGPNQDFSGSGADDYDFYANNPDTFSDQQGGPQEQMQQGPQGGDSYEYDGDYSD